MIRKHILNFKSQKFVLYYFVLHTYERENPCPFFSIFRDVRFGPQVKIFLNKLFHKVINYTKPSYNMQEQLVASVSNFH